MLRRSSHIAVRVTPDQVESAVEHYKAVLGVEEKTRSEDGVELTGANFTLWIDSDQQCGTVLQEFLCNDAAEVRSRIERAGGTVTGESPHGFYVQDPFGLTYHVFVEEDVEA